MAPVHGLAIAFVLVGLILIFLVVRYVVRVVRGVPVKGVVTHITARRTGGSLYDGVHIERTAHISYRFRDEEFTIEFNMGIGAIPHFRKGDELTVVVDETNPARGVVRSWQVIFLWFGLLLIAIVLLTIGSVIWLVKFGVLQTNPP